MSGATGEIGIRVARGLVDRGTAQRLIVRDTGRAPSIEGAELSVASGYHNDDGMRRALEAVPGVGTTVSNHVERVAGHAPEALVPFLRARPELWHHLVATS